MAVNEEAGKALGDSEKTAEWILGCGCFGVSGFENSRSGHELVMFV